MNQNNQTSIFIFMERHNCSNCEYCKRDLYGYVCDKRVRKRYSFAKAKITLCNKYRDAKIIDPCELIPPTGGTAQTDD